MERANSARPGCRSADAFGFDNHLDATQRTVEAMTTLMAAPWRAWWAFAFETLNPEHYRLRR